MVATSVIMECLEAVQDRIKHLGLSGVLPSRIYIRKFPWDKNVTHPAVFIAPVNEQLADATNCDDDYGYGLQITLSQSSNRDVVIEDDRLLLWRQRTMAAFHNQRLPGVGKSYQCKIEPGPVYDPTAFGQNYDASSMVVRCWTRQQRGTAQ